jgi:hypothetical protein
MKKILTLLAAGFALAGCVHLPSVTSLHAPPAIVQPAVKTPPTTIKSTVDREVALMWVAAALLAIGAGVCAYLQNYFIAIKLGCAALALPICATFFALYWGWIIAAALVAGAAFIFIHYKVVLLPAIETEIQKIKKL